MDVHPKVSIILVNYNGYSDTIECLQSLRAITYPNYETIIVDNASTDESVAAIREYIRKEEILITSDVNGGFSFGNNIGIKYAIKNGTDFCLLLDNDTIVEPNFLDKLIDGFSYSQRCGLTIGKILYESSRDIIWYAGGSTNGRTAKTSHWRYGERDELENERIQTVTFATGCCMCISRSALEAVGYLDENYFLYEEDADYCCRMLKAGYELLYIPEARIYHKVSASTKKLSSLSQYYLIRNKYYLINKYYEGINKIFMEMYSTVHFLYQSFRGQFELRILGKAFSAYRKGKMGKVESM